MADLVGEDGVNNSVSVASHADVSTNTTQPTTVQEEREQGDVDVKNGVNSSISQPSASIHTLSEEQALEDGTAKSNASGSRPDGSATGDADSADARVAKKISTNKPVTFAKYSVSKVISANQAKASAEKVLTPVSTATPASIVGRPRLVAKTTSSLSAAPKSFRNTAPDPMQVWNKNRVVPQPSTKNLTDEELKQQYGISLTSRLQSDDPGKQSNWADIDEDDEDDWAPDTIEWGDGTKTTVPTGTTPDKSSVTTSKPGTPSTEAPKMLLTSKPAVTFTNSIGPNATVLKIGASAERQHAQKASQPSRGPVEKIPLLSSKTTPAPAPAKSPWAALPPVDKIAPVEINPQFDASQPPRHGPLTGSHSYGSNMIPLSPAREMSADAFDRTWKGAPNQDSRELFIPNSGRYEPVPEHKRRLSRNESGYRAAIVLQRPGQADGKGAGPSAAFQTTRTSSDAIRRRTSSIISAEAGSFGRRMSSVTGDVSGPVIDESPHEILTNGISQGPSNKAEPHMDEGVMKPVMVQTEAELETQKAQQKAAMRQQAIDARTRRLELEEKENAERLERIRRKLESLGPDPKALRAEEAVTATATATADAKNMANITVATDEAQIQEPSVAHAHQDTPKAENSRAGISHGSTEPKLSPDMPVTKPTTKREIIVLPQRNNALESIQNLSSDPDEESPEPPYINGIEDKSVSSLLTPALEPTTETSARQNRPVSVVSEVRGWSRHDHRASPGANLWSLPSNKSLGNGAFDSSLASYAPHDLSSRASSTGQGWMNGRTPTIGQSPQMSHVHSDQQHVPETRSQTLQNMTSPEPASLSLNSQPDMLGPVRPPAPIGPTHVMHVQHAAQGHTTTNGYANGAQSSAGALAGWNNFHSHARVQDRADAERHQREQRRRQEEEEKTGTRPQASYNFNESFKQVSIGEDPTQRHVQEIPQINLPPSKIFGAVGSGVLGAIGPSLHGQARSSRFFPSHVNGTPPSLQPQRQFVPSQPILTLPSPSPPPAEELFSSHPAYEHDSARPIIRLPPEKAIVRLPPSQPTVPSILPPEELKPASPKPEPVSIKPAMPLTWAARVAQPPPVPKSAPIPQALSQKTVPVESWQEKINGLLGTATSRNCKNVEGSAHLQYMYEIYPPEAVESISRGQLDIRGANMSESVSVRLGPKARIEANENAAELVEFSAIAPGHDATESQTISTRFGLFESEEDLYEDREPGSLPVSRMPTEAPAIIWPRPCPARIMPKMPETQSIHSFMVHNWREDSIVKQHFAIVKVFDNDKSIRKDLLPRREPTITQVTIPNPAKPTREINHVSAPSESGSPQGDKRAGLRGRGRGLRGRGRGVFRGQPAPVVT